MREQFDSESDTVTADMVNTELNVHLISSDSDSEGTIELMTELFDSDTGTADTGNTEFDPQFENRIDFHVTVVHRKADV